MRIKRNERVVRDGIAPSTLTASDTALDDAGGIVTGPTARQPDPKTPRGRPRDHDLTARLKDGALVILARQGVERLTVDGLTLLTGAGRGGVYRRWDSMLDLAAEAIAECALVPPVPDTGTPTDDLLQLMHPFTTVLGRDELAAAALLSVAHHHVGVKAALHHVVVAPLLVATTAIDERHVRHENTPPTRGALLLHRTVGALWWNRYIAAPPPQTPDQLRELVTTSLLPILLS